MTSRNQSRSTWGDGVQLHPLFEEYRGALDDRFGELVDSPITIAALQPRLRVTATWELTLDLRADQGMAPARPLLRLLAHFADAPIPYAMVLSPKPLAASPLFVLRNENDSSTGHRRLG